jgi:hypothetical protein
MTQHDLAARIVAELNGMLGATDAEKAQALIDAGLVPDDPGAVIDENFPPMPITRVAKGAINSGYLSWCDCDKCRLIRSAKV